jgi:hypothetical protein
MADIKKNDIKKSGLVIGGVFSAEVPDKAGEQISVQHMDISSLNSGKAILNSEHQSGNFSSYLGRILDAKKIFKDEDCTTDHERQCFENVGKNPMIYGRAELFSDEEGHTEAKHAAAVIRAFKKNNLPIAAQFSIEGSSLEKEGNHIKRSIARRVALTISPANESCESDVLSDLSKSEKTTYQQITKPSAKGITSELLVIDESEIFKSLDNLQNVFAKLQKALEAGVGVGAPGTLTQGAALQGSSRKTKTKKAEETSSPDPEETTPPGEETTQESSKEESLQVKPLDEDKADKIDDKVKEMSLKDIKIKKAQVFIYKNLKVLEQG